MKLFVSKLLAFRLPVTVTKCKMRRYEYYIVTVTQNVDKTRI